jgi:hypothetical protein
MFHSVPRIPRCEKVERSGPVSTGFSGRADFFSAPAANKTGKHFKIRTKSEYFVY